jgi:hypothetical protein
MLTRGMGMSQLIAHHQDSMASLAIRQHGDMDTVVPE